MAGIVMVLATSVWDSADNDLLFMQRGKFQQTHNNRLWPDYCIP